MIAKNAEADKAANSMKTSYDFACVVCREVVNERIMKSHHMFQYAAYVAPVFMHKSNLMHSHPRAAPGTFRLPDIPMKRTTPAPVRISW
jgi:hypothetical protein